MTRTLAKARRLASPQVAPVLAAALLFVAACGGDDGLSPEDVELRIDLEVARVEGEIPDTTLVANPTTARPGDRLQTSWTVTNVGSMPVPLFGSFHRSEGFREPGVGIGTDAPLRTLEPSETAVGSEIRFWTIPDNAPPGPVSLTVGVEGPTGEVAEQYELTVVEP